MSFIYPLPLPEKILTTLVQQGINNIFPVQKLSALPLYEGKNLKIQAPTGSGKTLAYLLPLGLQLQNDRDNNLVVMASSPELAAQICNVFRSYFPEIDTALIIGGTNLSRQKDKLKTRPRAIFATPGRLFELFCLEYVKIDDNTTVVLDECDSLIEGNQLKKIFSLAESAGQLVTASATFNDESLNFLSSLPQDIENIEVETREGSVSHAYLFCSDDKKEISLIKLLRMKKFKNSLIFVNDIRHVGHLANELKKNGFTVAVLDSNKSKLEREKAVQQLRLGQIQTLVTTDSLARGMDFVNLAAIIQFGIARDEEIYIHRSGRVGRAGAHGECISLVSKKDSFVLFNYVKKLDLEINELALTSSKSKPQRKELNNEALPKKPKKKKNRVNKDKGKPKRKPKNQDGNSTLS